MIRSLRNFRGEAEARREISFDVDSAPSKEPSLSGLGDVLVRGVLRLSLHTNRIGRNIQLQPMNFRSHHTLCTCRSLKPRLARRISFYWDIRQQHVSREPIDIDFHISAGSNEQQEGGSSRYWTPWWARLISKSSKNPRSD